MEKLMSETEKRKMINLIQQGEGKNTKKILQMPEVKQKLQSILGEKEGLELANCLIEIGKYFDGLDLTIPVENRGISMTNMGGDSLLGGVYVDWE